MKLCSESVDGLCVVEDCVMMLCVLRLASCVLRLASCVLRVACCVLRVACCLFSLVSARVVIGHLQCCLLTSLYIYTPLHKHTTAMCYTPKLDQN